MPAAPESREVGGKEGRLEVFRQFEAQEKPHGPGYFGVARKVEVELQGIPHGAQQQHGAAVVLVVGEDLVHKDAQHVADCHQLEETQRHEPQPPHGAGGVKAVFLLELGQQRPGPADGPLGDGGKKVQKQRTADETGFHLAVAPGGVDEVGDGRKAVKADAQRHGHGLPARQPLESAVIFEEGKDAQQPDDPHPQGGNLVGTGQRPAAEVSEHRNGDGHPQHGRHGQGVEHPAGRQQKGTLDAPGQMQIHRGHHQQKAEKAKTLQAQRRTS